MVDGKRASVESTAPLATVPGSNSNPLPISVVLMRDQDFFWEGVQEGTILVQRCDACGSLRQPPGPMCPQCQSRDWHPKAMSGRGSVYAFIVSKHPTLPDGDSRLVVLVELEEGVRMVSNLVDVDVSDVRLGTPVQAIFRDVAGTTLPLFQVASEP